MYFTSDSTHQYIIRLNRGQQVIASLKKFCQKQMIGGAFFYGLGAVDQAEIAHYNLDTKQYSKKNYQEMLEVTNLTGNIAMEEGDLVVHAHVTLGTDQFQALAGHLVEMRVSGAMEIYLQALQPLSKTEDSVTGLKLLQLDQSL